MVSFVCDHCQETIKKPRLDQHAARCRSSTFSCLDCSKTFKGTSYREHYSCITEKEKCETIPNNTNRIKTQLSSGINGSSIINQDPGVSVTSKFIDETIDSSDTYRMEYLYIAKCVRRVLKKNPQGLSISEIKAKILPKKPLDGRLVDKFLKHKLTLHYNSKCCRAK